MLAVVLAGLIGVGIGGCETKNAAREQARAAYVAGQGQAQARQQQMQSQLLRPTVTVQGQVDNSVVAWERGLTLNQAIVMAHYTGFMNPSSIRVIRNGRVARQFEATDLLRGQNMDLEPGDVVLLTP
jgi:hypothetical protein